MLLSRYWIRFRCLRLKPSKANRSRSWRLLLSPAACRSLPLEPGGLALPLKAGRLVRIRHLLKESWTLRGWLQHLCYHRPSSCLSVWRPSNKVLCPLFLFLRVGAAAWASVRCWNLWTPNALWLVLHWTWLWQCCFLLVLNQYRIRVGYQHSGLCCEAVRRSGEFCFDP